jgi:nucleoside-diphosphate-sugar epimerase
MRDPVIAITGANGHVGSLIVGALAPQARIVRLVRNVQGSDDIAWSFAADPAEFAAVLRARGVTHLVHAAWDMSANALADLERSCVTGSANLLAAAAAAGIDKTIFISTISAFAGARSAYGRSKLMVEQMVLDRRGIVLRFGLVYGDGDDGVFGNMKKIVRSARIVPMIGDGRAPQYLLHERTLAEAVRKAIDGALDGAGSPITVAQPEPIVFRDLLRHLAASERRTITLVALPWRLLYWGLKCAETIGLKLNFRSDSIISFVYQNPAPDFRAMTAHGIEPVRLIRLMGS